MGTHFDHSHIFSDGLVKLNHQPSLCIQRLFQKESTCHQEYYSSFGPPGRCVFSKRVSFFFLGSFVKGPRASCRCIYVYVYMYMCTAYT